MSEPQRLGCILPNVMRDIRWRCGRKVVPKKYKPLSNADFNKRKNNQLKALANAK